MEAAEESIAGKKVRDETETEAGQPEGAGSLGVGRREASGGEVGREGDLASDARLEEDEAHKSRRLRRPPDSTCVALTDHTPLRRFSSGASAVMPAR